MDRSERHSLQLEDRSVGADVFDPFDAAVSQLRRRIVRHEFACAVIALQLHVEMDGAMSLIRAHEISDEVEAKLRAAYPNAEIIIHQDPEGIEEPRANFPRRVAAG